VGGGDWFLTVRVECVVVDRREEGVLKTNFPELNKVNRGEKGLNKEKVRLLALDGHGAKRRTGQGIRKKQRGSETGRKKSYIRRQGKVGSGRRT